VQRKWVWAKRHPSRVIRCLESPSLQGLGLSGTPPTSLHFGRCHDLLDCIKLKRLGVLAPASPFGSAPPPRSGVLRVPDVSGRFQALTTLFRRDSDVNDQRRATIGCLHALAQVLGALHVDPLWARPSVGLFFLPPTESYGGSSSPCCHPPPSSHNTWSFPSTDHRLCGSILAHVTANGDAHGSPTSTRPSEITTGIPISSATNPRALDSLLARTMTVPRNLLNFHSSGKRLVGVSRHT